MKNLKAFKENLSKDFEQNSPPSLFQIKPVNEWMDEAKKRPIPKMLFGEFWHEGELCILFADSNQGKSVLAVQIADSISSGYSTCSLELGAKRQSVIYLDFELSDKQFECRYSDNYKNHFHFNNNFFRAEIKPNSKIPKEFKSFEDYLTKSIERVIVKHNSKILIIDNISYLKNGTEKASEATTLMIFLNELKKKYNLSILVLAHTPKRDYSKPISKNDLSGSKSLMNFCDSSFAIGQSFNTTGIKYLKQIKQRVVEEKYGIENVISYSLKKDINFLKFEFIGFENELNHIKQLEYNSLNSRNEKIASLKSEGNSNVAIAEQLNISEGTVRNVLKKMNR